MAGPELSPAKAILLAVQLAIKSDIQTLRSLVSLHRKTLHNELVLRILLSHLPESLDSSEYVSFIEDLISGGITTDPKHSIDDSLVSKLDDEAAKKRVRKLHLLPLAWPNAPEDAPSDNLTLFLIHRSLRVDQNTGLLTQLPGLLVPFLQYSDQLRTWMISTILPLLRLSYEYHPESGAAISISKFETLDHRTGVSLLLSRTGTDIGRELGNTVGRDVRGLIGPWMYGDTKRKRRKVRENSSFNIQVVEQSDETPVVSNDYVGWEEVFKWIIGQAGTSWKTAVEVIEQWDGPGDVDLGGYEDMSELLGEEDQLRLERRYARSAIATAYIISGDPEEVLNGVQRILTRITTLLDQDRIPTLQAAAALLTPFANFEKDEFLSPKTASYLRNELLDERNPLTAPNIESVKFLHALLIGAYLCTKAGCPLGIKQVGQLALLQDEHDQMLFFNKLMLSFSTGPKDDDKYWVKMRNEILWLRDWGAEELSEGIDVNGKGIFGRLPKRFIEGEILKSFLAKTRYTLARSIYETAPDRPLPAKVLHDNVIAAAMNEYDNATNANRTRGGVKRCDEILHAFPETLAQSLDRKEMEHLITVTHYLGQYRLVFKQGEPFKPVSLRVHGDPISIIGKVLEQNPKSYTKMEDFVDMGKNIVRAGLTRRDHSGNTKSKTLPTLAEEMMAEKRVVSMCIDAALAEDDFETAYSYVVTRLKDIAGPAHERHPDHKRPLRLSAEPPPKIMDDWSWRAALQAGKYRRTSQTAKPTHLGNSSGNPEIRHLEQRMECLAQALRIAPKATLQEILNVYRRCEEELESLVKQEAAQEEAWDAQGDDQTMPGGYAAMPIKKHVATNTSRSVEEAPMSLFDLSRSSIARAQSGFSSLSMLRGNNATPNSGPESFPGNEEPRNSISGSGPPKDRIRKRDQLKNVAVGGLASGIGWLINAPPVNLNEERDDDR